MTSRIAEIAEPIESRPIAKAEYVVCRGRKLCIVKKNASPRADTKLLKVAKAIVQFIESQDFLELSPAERLQVIENAEFINKKIEKRNFTIYKSRCLRFLDLALYILSFGKYRLRLASIDIASFSNRMLGIVEKSAGADFISFNATVVRIREPMLDLFLNRSLQLTGSIALARLAEKTLKLMAAHPGVWQSGDDLEYDPSLEKGETICKEAGYLHLFYEISSAVKNLSEDGAGDIHVRIFKIAKRYCVEAIEKRQAFLKAAPSNIERGVLLDCVTHLTPRSLAILLKPLSFGSGAEILQLQNCLNSTTVIPEDLQRLTMEYASPTTNLLQLFSAAVMIKDKEIRAKELRLIENWLKEHSGKASSSTERGIVLNEKEVESIMDSLAKPYQRHGIVHTTLKGNIRLLDSFNIS